MRFLVLNILFIFIVASVSATDHPRLILTSESVPELGQSLGTFPLWKQAVENLEAEVNELTKNPVDVPIPVDPAGGYTHGQHKQNGKLLKNLGVLFQVTGNKLYAAKARDIFLAYAQLYPSLGSHPVKKSYAPGKFFWQQLNDAVWLINVIQGYDCIYDFLSPEERKQIEDDLLLAHADFLSIENPKVFNRIHNHGVWAVAAVGMTGIALGKDELVYRAFYGIDENGKPNKNELDTDNLESLEMGFFAQTSQLFSPDGYYTEGPYYQRYAMTPFLLFAKSINNNIPEVGILEFRNQIFYKAIETLIALTDGDGKYLPINDNLKGMSLKTPSSVAAVSFLYAQTKQPELLSILQICGLSLVDNDGLAVIKGLDSKLEMPLKQKSRLISDGSDGKSGGIGLLRDAENEFCAVFKYASHGLSHGHYDRLNLFYYHGASEVLTDYGAARYVNVKAKEGGRYLPENKSYARQTIAHNTLIVDEKSHFNYKYKEASKYSAELVFANINDVDLQVVSAIERNAYPGIEMQRTVAYVTDSAFENPIIVDFFSVKSAEEHVYDFPFHFNGQLMSTEFEYESNSSSLLPFGEKNGYQHLWVTAKGKSIKSNTGITWLNNHYLYSITTVVDTNSELYLTQIGANDPNFNLRNEPAFIVRNSGKTNHNFASIIECHGYQNPNTEIVSNQVKQIESIKILDTENPYAAVEFTTSNNKEFILVVYTLKGDSNEEHTIELNGGKINWQGNYTLLKY